MAYKQTPEGAVLSACCEYLEYNKYFFFRTNNGAIFDPTRGIHRAFPKWCVKGVSDLILLYRGKTYFLEVKSLEGKQSEDQKKFQANVEANGCPYHIIRSSDDLIKLGF